MDWTSLSRLVPEIALVIIFIWFTLERDKRVAIFNEQREARQLEANIRQEANWQAFLKDQRELNNAAITRIAEEVKSNTMVISTMNNLLISHDSRTMQLLTQSYEKQARNADAL